MKIKTNELTGAALDWAVARCEFVGTPPFVIWNKGVWQPDEGYQYTPSTDWAQGGPIIEREKLQVTPSIISPSWYSACPAQDMCVAVWADTPLIAAMRCYVASKLGDEVDVPEELTMLGERR